MTLETGIIEWNAPMDYGIVSRNQLEQCGFMDIAELLDTEYPEEILGACSEDTLLIDKVIASVQIYEVDKRLGQSCLYAFKGIKIVVSYYDGGMSALSFLSDDKENVEKQLLSLHR